jgi:hypothetical protein
VIVFLHHVTTARAYDPKIGPRHLKRRRRNCSVDTLSVNDLAMDLVIGSTIDSTTNVTMSGIQSPAPSVGSKTIPDIGLRLRTDLAEAEKNEEACTSTCLAVDAARPSHHSELFCSGKGPRWVSYWCKSTA